MKIVKLSSYLWLLVMFHLGQVTQSAQPHIIFMVGDDFGWNDIGFHNPDIRTPNMDHLACNGIILNSSYVQPLCTPSRTAFMTGYFPYKTGMQFGVIPFFGPYGVPLQFKMLPETLRELGYSTHIVGKWHLGSCNSSYFPTSRGFDSFFGYMSGGEYYDTHSITLSNNPGATTKTAPMVYDFWNMTTIISEYDGVDSSIPFVKQVQHILETRNKTKPLFLYLPFQLTHSPSQVNAGNLNWYPKITNVYRKYFSAMVSQLDTDVGQIINLLKLYEVYNESIIVFTADNGGETQDGGNNYPLRGKKNTLYEGATRASAFIHSPLLPTNQINFTYDGLVHAVDWYPTFVSLAGGTPDTNMDGVNVWNAITTNSKSPREEFVYNLQFVNGKLSGAIRTGDWKLIVGVAGLPNTQIAPEQVTGELFNVPGGFLNFDDIPNYPPYRLYNISDDPTESNDISKQNPDVVQLLMDRIKEHKKKMVQALFSTNIGLYMNLTTNLKYLNTNWCEPISTVTLDSQNN